MRSKGGPFTHSSVAVFAATALVLSGQDHPPDRFVSKGACPFECCTYREWIAKNKIDVFDYPNGHVIAHLEKGQHVLGITGEVITPHPLRFQVKGPRDALDRSGVPAGSVVYLLHPVGEGFWMVWYEGKTVVIDPDSTGPFPIYQWWAKIKTRSGQIGWVPMKADHLLFQNVDACA